MLLLSICAHGCHNNVNTADERPTCPRSSDPQPTHCPGKTEAVEGAGGGGGRGAVAKDLLLALGDVTLLHRVTMATPHQYQLNVGGERGCAGISQYSSLRATAHTALHSNGCQSDGGNFFLPLMSYLRRPTTVILERLAPAHRARRPHTPSALEAARLLPELLLQSWELDRGTLARRGALNAILRALVDKIKSPFCPIQWHGG